MKKRLIYYFGHALSIAAMLLVALVFLMPLWWIIITSFKFDGDVNIIPPSFWPNPATASHYVWLFEKFNFVRYFFNSSKLAVVGAVGQILSCSLGGFAFARMHFPFKKILFALLMGTMMIPSQVTMIPQFIIFSKLGFVDTYVPLMLPPFLGGAFGVFLLRQFFLTIPLELEEAARLDGCSVYRIYWNIFIPNAKPSLATLGIFAFMYHWNDLFGPVIYLVNDRSRTLTIVMALFQDTTRVKIPVTMCAALISMLPLIIMYLFAQRYFVQAVVSSGLKG
jgi:multiple sugar transport system permease protein